MKIKHITAAMLAALIAGTGLLTPTTATWAQEEQELTEEEKKKKAEEAAAERRRRFGPTKVSVTAGEHEIFLLTGALKAEGVDYEAIDTMKAGDAMLLTKSQAIKLSTEANMKFGDVVAKKENYAPGYPGVYSLWIKKTADGWKMAINSQPDLWGTMYRPKEDIGEVDVTYSTNAEPSEKLNFELTCSGTEGTLAIVFGKHKWTTPFTVVN